MITQKRLKELLTYSKSSGYFRWRFSRAKCRRGAIAGTLDNGYIKIAFDGKSYLAHRLAILYVTGSFPPSQTDHINLIRSDNRWRNIRLATRSQNQMNAPSRSRSPLRLKGVYFDGKKFIARGNKDGKTLYLGIYETAQEAHNAYCEHAKKTYGQFYRAS